MVFCLLFSLSLLFVHMCNNKIRNNMGYVRMFVYGVLMNTYVSTLIRISQWMV